MPISPIQGYLLATVSTSLAKNSNPALPTGPNLGRLLVTVTFKT